MIKAILVDDEAPCLKDIDELLKLYPNKIQVIGKANTLADAEDLIQLHRPDVVFLDIQVGSGNSISWLKTFGSIDFQIIFTTGYDRYAIDAFKFSAIDYLLKPIVPDELESAIDKLSSRSLPTSSSYQALQTNYNPETLLEKLVLADADNIYLIEIKDIVRCEASNNYTIFFLEDEKKLLISKPLKEYAELLVKNKFFRIHKSHLINLNYFQKYDKREGGSVVLKNGLVLPLASRRRDELIQCIQQMG